MTDDQATESQRINIRAIIEGTVQGVFFRASTLEQAQSLGVGGVVRNLPDGTVELIAQGATEQVEELLKWAHHGPPDAMVSSVSIREQTVDEALVTFSIDR